MVATRIELRDFRNYEHAELSIPPGLTVVAGPNGAGKTNLLEGLYFGCTARSPRTSNERELVRRGASVTRVVLETAGEDEGTASRSASSRASPSACGSTAALSTACRQARRGRS